MMEIVSAAFRNCQLSSVNCPLKQAVTFLLNFIQNLYLAPSFKNYNRILIWE